MDGTWLFRLDPGNRGIRSGWNRSRGTAGWARVKVPSVWNLGDDSPASMIGGVGWYRKDFTVPEASKALEWAVRFESVNYRSRVWLNGKPVGSNAGAYIPFELRLRDIKRRRHEPAGNPRRLAAPQHRLPARRPHRRRPPDRRLVELLGHAARGLPQAPQPGGLEGRAGGPAAAAHVRAGQGHRPEREGVGRARPHHRPLRLEAPQPRQRQPLRRRDAVVDDHDPGARREAVDAVAAVPLPGQAHGLGRAGAKVSSYQLRTGIRTVRVAGDGRLLLNGKRVHLRGVGVHEESQAQGFAVDNAFRSRLVSEVKAVGATLMRTHYPLHPYTQELADKEGVLIWSEVPVYTLSTPNLVQARRDRARGQGGREEHRRQPDAPVGAAVVDRATSSPRAPGARRPPTSRTPSAWRSRSTRAGPSASPWPATRRSPASRPTARST